MDVPSDSDILLSPSSKDSVSVQIHGQSGDVTNRKRKRSVSEDNLENTEETPTGKRVRKSGSKKYKDLPAEVAEEKRRLVNQQERLRQKQIAQAIQRLKNLNLPFNPNVTNHKRDSTMYTISTATDLIIALRKMCTDNGIDPDIQELPSQSEGKQVQHCETSTSRNCKSTNHNVPQCSSTLVDVSNRQQYLCGNTNICPQNNKTFNQPETYCYQTVPGVNPGAHMLMCPLTFGPYNNAPLQVHPMTRLALNGCIDMTGHRDVTNRSSLALVSSVPPAGNPTLLSKPVHSTPGLPAEAQAKVPLGTPLPTATTPLQSARTAITSSPAISQNDHGAFEREFNQWMWQ